MNYNFNDLKICYENIYQRDRKKVILAKEYLNSFLTEERITKYKKEAEEENKKNSFNFDFNILKVMSEKYYTEDFHSDIIKQLLKNKAFLNPFLSFIDVDYKQYKDCEVLRENCINSDEDRRGRIDILIKSKKRKRAVIIENKINWAGDTYRQLKKYYDYISEKFKVDRMVYLVPDSGKIPENQSIDGIPKKLIKIVVGYDGGVNDFYTQCVKKGIKNLKINSKKEWFVLAEHYLQILKEKGGSKMSSLEKDFYEDIKAKNENLEKTHLIADIYNDYNKGDFKMEVLEKDFYENLINNKGELDKVKLIAEMYNELGNIRAKNMRDIHGGSITPWGGNQWLVNCGGKIPYKVDVEFAPNSTNILISSKSKNEKSKEEDRKVIENLLKKNKLFGEVDGVYCTKSYQFPEEEKELYEYLDKLINVLSK
ncbi:PD-(D/E)XK nuclease family protein [Brachyspira catarrhinii]|uniref:PD-(D/E)XK nuclease family protein n=1 Tax=Brachyspira catarrhinii TaxID=2528966 RepID=A0ABY2TU48_9SPIR|nr:PD-(D/E)XK nuclease family protein [Brachyspira catarrhinii]TKZ36396.1 hypothetical protein EZH24_00385 [Brachyspira catarrhinii]